MKTKETIRHNGQLISVIVICLVAAFIVLSTAVKKRPVVKVNEAAAETILVDTMTAMTEAANPEPYIPAIETAAIQSGQLNFIADGKVISIGKDYNGWGLLDAAYPELGLQQLNCVLAEDDRILIGGDRLLIYNNDYSEVYEECDFKAPVNVILKFGEGYLVGTEAGLYFYDSESGDTLLKSGLEVTCMTEDQDGLWVGTSGDGLWRFNGDRWQRRYLLRDTSIFDFVNTLAYSYPNLWVGTPSGIFKFDGGKWSQLFVSDSTEVYEVNSIQPGLLATYIGTEQGLCVYANDSLKAVDEFAMERIAAVSRAQKDIIVTTRESGIFKLKGKEEILRPEQLLAEETVLADN